ncbi:MAG TPA: OmpA family protein [Tepidisphaeraceae bacterium]|nr:OmpA family protein [Tepidisphaeraceae bacterium]
MARMWRWVSIAAMALVVGGCVSQEKYNALKLDRDQLAERLASSDAESRAAKAQADLLRKQLEALNSAGGTQSSLLTSLTQQNADLQQQLRDLNQKYMEALNRSGQGSPLPPAANQELQVLADKYPDLMEFDAKTGMVKFKGDVTFASGEATLTPRAKEVIDKFASILNSQSIADYDLLVAGHTDNVRVSNPATIARGHKDNWYLSAHRAISVGEELMHNGVSANRIGVAGYADEHPIASNDTAAGRAQNRRVEVLIMPKALPSSSTGEASSAPQSAPKEAPANASSAMPTKP